MADAIERPLPDMRPMPERVEADARMTCKFGRG
jgi:hypothetical protein